MSDLVKRGGEAWKSLKDLAATLFDGLVDLDGPLTDIPGARAVLGFARAGRGIGEMLLAAKLERFLDESGDMLKEAREEVLEKLQTDKKYRAAVGECVLVHLNEFDEMAKAHLFAHTFAAFLRGEIELHALREVGSALSRCFYPNLYILSSQLTVPDKRNGLFALEKYATELAGCGLVEQARGRPGVEGPEGPGPYCYRLTPLGETFRKIGLPERAGKLIDEDPFG